eukprot:m.412581 g.412581  ORF g.412581 m.412581 type:complete len:157 (-) comp28885_c0_seq1:1326-1796(-)
MTGVIDRYAVISEHLHYNPSFDEDTDSERVVRRESNHGVGYLDVAKNPEEERVRLESFMAEETEPTSEIIFQTGGRGTDHDDKTDDFNFELPESPPSPDRRMTKAKDQVIDLRTGTGLRNCACWQQFPRSMLVAGGLLALGMVAVVVMIAIGIIPV